MATDEESVVALSRIKQGAEVFVDVVRAGERNRKQQRLFFALAKVVADSMELDVDTVRKDALIRLGYTNTRMRIDGSIEITAKSMKVVGGMTQAEFTAFMDKAVNLMATWIDADHKDLMRRYNELAADKRYVPR